MIKINLFDYREQLNRETIQKRVINSSAIVIACLVMILFTWLFEKSRISRVNSDVRELEQQVNALQGTVNLVKSMQKKQKRVGSILKGIENLRNDQLAATKILFDVNSGVPESIWLTDISQMSAKELEELQVPTILLDDPNKPKPKNNNNNNKNKIIEPKEFIQLTGHALEDQAVARFVERLEEIPYYKMVFLFKTEQVLVGKTPVRKFTIYCYMPKNPDKTVA